MKKSIKILLVALLFLGFLNWYIEASVTIIPLNQIKAGMKGKGRSVFIDNKIEEFDVEILGILYNFQPKRNLILAKLQSQLLDKTGVMSGMSGSPIYIDGKLIGAVAYSFPFAKEAIAGITPIEEMLAIQEKKIQKTSFSSQMPIKKYMTLEELFEINKNFFMTTSPTFVEGQAFSPLTIPLVFSGFSSRVFEQSKSFFLKMGFNPIRSGPGGQSVEKLSVPDLTLREGDPVGVQLITGDLNLSFVGTVTHVDGNNVLAFGHPLFNLGSVDYAMAKAKVVGVVPSLSSSLKLAVTDTLVGRFVQDRNSGIFGELGKMPLFIPVNIKMLNDKGEIKDFKVKVVDDKILTPFFVNIALSNVLSIEERAVGDLSLELNGKIYLENGKSINLEDLFSGNFDTSITTLSSLLTAVVYFLTNNEFQDLSIHRIDLNIRASEEVKFSYLEKVWLDKYDVAPGEHIRIKVYSRNFRGDSVLQEVSIAAPLLPSGSEFYLIVADAASMQQVEFGQYKKQAFVPRSLNQLIRMLSNLRKNNRIYFRIIAAKPGLFLKGEEMPNLPPTMKSMFSSARVATSVPTELNKSTLREYQLPVPYVFQGAAVIPIKIK
ncbi:MAG: hypothetical protein IBX60_04230 [Candidatus Aminicenantes bacterium]|nr:hypothetical protein [Candidatus Aminicenantes bacterium]